MSSQMTGPTPTPQPKPQLVQTIAAPQAAPQKAPRPAWSAQRQVIIGFVTLFVLFGGFGVWAVTTNIAGAIVTSGQLEVEQHRQVVQHPDGGVVASITVHEGDTVKAGDVLLTLDGSSIRSELAIVEGQLFEIMARRARLTAERDNAADVAFPDDLKTLAASRAEVAEQMDGQARLFAARADTLAKQTGQLSERKNQIKSQILGITAQADALTTQLRLIQEELANQRGLLDKGLAEASRVLALQREEARLRGSVGEVIASKAQAEESISETEIEILRLDATRREEANTQLRDIGSQELELIERRRALTERVERLEIRAPVSGIVLGLQFTTPRSVVRPADQIMYLIPQDRPLVIAAQVPPIHIDQVVVGQEVKLHFSSFSSRTTPELKGRISVVSADALTDQRTQAPYYRAEIVLEPGELEKLNHVTLIPGMPVEAFIKTDDRTPFAYLIKPFTDYFGRAFRET